MPNFTTHWLVADMCIGKAGGIMPLYITEGRNEYYRAVREMTKQLHAALKGIKNQRGYYRFINRSSFLDKQTGGFEQIILDFDMALKGIGKKQDGTYKPQDMAVYDSITCFSAYMLGACGPDLWTVPSEGNPAKIKHSVASHHFDLGHYNRTHMVFKHFVHQLAARQEKFPCPGGQPGLQAKAAIAYFTGLATHFAADLILHQLVNVSAGAYWLLEEKWMSEQRDVLLKLWNTHNKVEHYWDVYLRYRIFSGYGPLWQGWDDRLWDGFPAPGFPVTESMARFVSDEGAIPFDYRKELKNFLELEESRLQVEKCHNLPRVFCDRMLEAGGGLTHFLYDIVVDKERGAYPGKIIPAGAFDEAVHEQFNDAAAPVRKDRKGNYTKEGKSERPKLRFFSSEANRGCENPGSFNYLAYKVLPDLAKVLNSGRQKFYDLTALPAFINAAVDTSVRFVGALDIAVNRALNDPGGTGDAESVNIGVLGLFWNLDCGTGLRILNDIDSNTTKEANPVLDFTHVLDAAGIKIGHSTDYSYLPEASASYGRKPPGAPLFHVYRGGTFESIVKVREEADRYLEKIIVANPVKSSRNIPVPTRGQNDNKTVVLQLDPMWDRVNLTVRSGIADLKGGSDDMGFFFLGDDRKKSSPGSSTLGRNSEERDFVRKWLCREAEYYDSYRTAQGAERNGVAVFARSANGVCTFGTHLLIMVQKIDDTMKQVIREGRWANTIPNAIPHDVPEDPKDPDAPYDKYRKRYGLNFAVGTGRKNVLHPAAAGIFQADSAFACCPEVTPTEYVPFSLRLLVRQEKTAGSRRGGADYMDIISREIFPVRKIREEIIRIDRPGFVKIALVYEHIQERDWGIELKECYIDGCKVHTSFGSSIF